MYSYVVSSIIGREWDTVWVNKFLGESYHSLVSWIPYVTEFPTSTNLKVHRILNQHAHRTDLLIIWFWRQNTKCGISQYVLKSRVAKQVIDLTPSGKNIDACLFLKTRWDRRGSSLFLKDTNTNPFMKDQKESVEMWPKAWIEMLIHLLAFDLAEHMLGRGVLHAAIWKMTRSNCVNLSLLSQAHV